SGPARRSGAIPREPPPTGWAPPGASDPVPGQHDVRNPVILLDSLRRALPRTRTTAPTGTTPDHSTSPDHAAPAGPRRSRALRIGALATALVVLTGGTLAYAGARKTVTLGVDGRTTEVTTFAGSVAGVIDAEGVDLCPRDVAAP